MQVTILEGACALQFERTVWIDSLLAVRPELLAIGLGLLDTWEIAVPLQDYKTLAISVGTEAEREKTKDLIRDLRVPLYDTRLIFMRSSPDVARLLELWKREGQTDLAFLRALYTVKPFILALPARWSHGRPPLMSDGAVWLAYGKSAEYHARESVKAYLEYNDTPTRVFAGEHEDNKQASRYFKTNLMQ